MMRKILEIDPEIITPPLGSILKGQGIPAGSQINKRTAGIAREALSSFLAIAQPVALVLEISKDDFQPIYHGQGNNAATTPLEDIYRAAHSFALFAVTLGDPICEEIGRLFGIDEYAVGAMLDSTASEAAELLATETERYYRDHLIRSDRLENSHAVMQFSPGYCGWHISAQAALFSALKPGEIGISLNDSFLMQPLKSISGVIVAGKRKIFEFEDSFDFCSDCRTRTCIERTKATREY